MNTTSVEQNGHDSPADDAAGNVRPIDLTTFITQHAHTDIDVLIVGSGYGAAMALHGLVGRRRDGRPLRIVMLERGEAYGRGDFPDRFADLAGHIRFSTDNPGTKQRAFTGRAHGLFDLRVGDGLNVLLANGLGGGSLINAGVMAEPLPEVMRSTAWPQAIRDDSQWPARFEQVRHILGGISSQKFGRRAQAMSTWAAQAQPGGTASSLHVTMRPDCLACGDCFTGCNHDAKLSMDRTVIAGALAHHPQGALHVVTGATVLSLQAQDPDDANTAWSVRVAHTRIPAERQSAHTLSADTVIVAAGALGSTELLMKSAPARPASGPKSGSASPLGRRFSGNGDGLAIVHDAPESLHGTAPPGSKPDERDVGPTITRCIDLRTDKVAPMVVQDLGVPVAWHRVFGELTHSMDALHRLTRADWRCHTPATQHDHARLPPDKAERSMLVALIGHDDANGELRLREPSPDTPVSDSDGWLTVRWPELKDDERFGKRFEHFAKMVTRSARPAGAPAPKVLNNPLHKPLPPALEEIWDPVKGPLTSVHPLGGCAMADTADKGVVNDLGQVYMQHLRPDGPYSLATANAVYRHLVVLDGSIVPTSLGINPALTIAALAHRAMTKLPEQWGFSLPGVSSLRPYVAPKHPAQPAPAVSPATAQVAGVCTKTATQVEMSESFWAMLPLNLRGQLPQNYLVHLELWFKPQSVMALTQSGADACILMKLDTQRSTLTISQPNPAEPHARNEAPQSIPLMRAQLSGHMSWMPLEGSDPFTRAIRGLYAWWCNRGLNEMGESGSMKGLGKRLFQGLTLASHAGQRRAMTYQLNIDKVLEPPGIEPAEAWRHASWQGQTIKIIKPLGYQRRVQPITQWMQGDLTTFPYLAHAGGKAPTIQLDPLYWRHSGIPLFRITHQATQPDALLDGLSLLLFMARLMLPMQMWAMRLPRLASSHPNPTRPEARLPALWPDLHCVRHTVHITPRQPGQPAAEVVLTRMRPHDSTAWRQTRPPVLLIHGYSASGSTFSHPALPQGGLGTWLARQGADVWVLDMRCSAGLSTATEPWRFAQMGEEDIPQAMQFVLAQTGAPTLDVVAHCMGAAMLTLGLLKPGVWSSLGYQLRNAPIRRLVLSQVGPAMKISPANTARAYLTTLLLHYLPLGPWYLTLGSQAEAASGRSLRTNTDDMLDRLLALVPYPDEDFDRMNPPHLCEHQGPWVGMRRRMDVLYGETFKLSQISDKVLAHLHELFGPLNLKTLSDVLMYANTRLVIDQDGQATVSPASIRAHMGHMDRIMSLHGADNQLVSPATARYLTDLFQAAGIAHQAHVIDGMGHQDCLIGCDAPSKVFERIQHFLA